MVLDANQLMYENRNYKDANHKIQALVKKGKLIPLKRGLYETDGAVSGCVLAYEIMGPSYLSFEYALSWHGLIPERVTTYTSAVFGKRKQLKFENQFGVFTYRDVPEQIFPFYYIRETFGNRPFFIATKEKALCDQLGKISPIRGLRDFKEYLFDGMRLDEAEFASLDFGKIRRIAPLYHRTNLEQLVKLIERGEMSNE